MENVFPRHYPEGLRGEYIEAPAMSCNSASSDNPVDYSKPFDIEVASRVHRLPPYLFGNINALLLKKRRAGKDVIDLGMGNPSDPPETR